MLKEKFIYKMPVFKKAHQTPKSRRPRKKAPKSTKAMAKAALDLARSNAAKVETKIVMIKGSQANHNFGAAAYIHDNFTDAMSPGSGEGQFNGTHCSLKSVRLKYRLQNARTGCPDTIRVMLVQTLSENTVGTDPGVPLDTVNLPSANHSGTDYCLATLKRFTEDPTVGAYTSRYKVLYDKMHKLASLDEGSGSMAESDIVVSFKGKTSWYSRDIGTVTSHEKNGLHLYILGGDVNRALGISEVDYKYIAQLRFTDQ